MRPRMMWQKPRSVMPKRLIMLLTTRATLQRLELRGSCSLICMEKLSETSQGTLNKETAGYVMLSLNNKT